MSRSYPVEATMEIERNDELIEVTLEGSYYPGCRGVKAHPMDRFAPPDDEPEMELLKCVDANGNEIELTDEEANEAEAALMKELEDDKSY